MQIIYLFIELINSVLIITILTSLSFCSPRLLHYDWLVVLTDDCHVNIVYYD